MIRRPPRATLSSSSAASDVYKRQGRGSSAGRWCTGRPGRWPAGRWGTRTARAVSYTHLRAHETPEHLVCRLLLEANKTPEHLVCRLRLEKKKKQIQRVWSRRR